MQREALLRKLKVISPRVARRLEKKRAYQQRIQEVEHSSFTPLVLSATGGMGNEATIFYKQLASLLSQKWDFPYNTTLCWLSLVPRPLPDFEIKSGSGLGTRLMLAQVPPVLLPPSLVYPSNQRCQILSGTCSEVTNCHRPCHH